MSQNQGATYRFGLFELDSRSGDLRKQGRPLKLRGRPIDILVLLLGRAGDVISRDELRQQLWPADTFVDFDHGLNSAMNRLRDALGDSAENPRFVETLPKRGYRFIAPIDVVSPAAPQTPDQPSPAAAMPARMPRRARLALACAMVVVAAVSVGVWRSARHTSGRVTLAVLPFENLSSEADQDFFSDGFTEEMIAELGALDPDRLGVIARTTTMLYKGARKDIGQIQRELGVEYVLEGSVRRAANRVRITAQLVQTSDRTQLWAESYDREVSDALGIQADVATRIARSLTLALKRPAGAAAPHALMSSPAYEPYLRGRFFREKATEESTRRALSYFERAVTLDPNYAAAYAGIADAYLLLGSPGWEVERPSGLLPRAEASAERALSVDPQSADAHAVLAMIQLNYHWDAAASEREIREALRLNPSSEQAHQYYSATLTTMRRFDEAIQEARRALELDPLSAPASTTLGIRYYYAGRIDEAQAQLAKTLETSPDFSVAHWGLAQGHHARGETGSELNELRLAARLSGDSAYMRAHLAYGYARAGDRARALAIRRELESEGADRYVSPYHSALMAVGLGDRDTMMRSLERLFADRSGWVMFLGVEPEFSDVRQAPEFQRLLARVRPAR